MDHGCKDVRHWLASFQLHEYTQAFINNGFTSLRKCCHLNESYLLQIQVPNAYHIILLDASVNLQIKFPDYKKHAPVDEDEMPPPLPEKKNRRSLPSPNVACRKHENKIPRNSLPGADRAPTAPPRRSVLIRDKHLTIPSSPNTDRSAELHLIDLLPPPPPTSRGSSPEPQTLLSPPPTLPDKSNTTFSEEVLQSMPKDCQTFLSSSPPDNGDMPSAYFDLSIVKDEAMGPPPSPNASQKKFKPAVKPRPSITPRPAPPKSPKPSPSPRMTVPSSPLLTPSSPITPSPSPVPVHKTSSNTLPITPSTQPPNDSRQKSSSFTFPVKTPRNNSKVSSLASRFTDEAALKAETTTSRYQEDEAVFVRKNTVKMLANTIQIPTQMIPAILPENKRMRYVIPHRKKIEPKVPRARRRVMTAGDESSEDTLDTSGEEDDTVKKAPGISPEPSVEVPLMRRPRSIAIKPEVAHEPVVKADSTGSTSSSLNPKIRLMTDNEVKERDKKWETKSGWLWKQGGHFKRISRHKDELFRRNNRGWKKRWFVFAENSFTYYTSDKPSAESLSCIALSNFLEVKIAQTEKDNSRQKYPFELITKHREYLLSAETSEERTLWCSILMIAITQYKGSILDDLLGGAMNSPDKSGLLRKQGNSRLRDWKTRYCAVKDGTFCYYESYEAYCIATPINSIYCGTLKAQISDRARFKFEVIVPNRTYYFTAQTESDMMSWIEALNKAVAAALTDLKSSGSTAKELISRIYEEPSNAVCADCSAPEPKWASINLGVVVCIRCSGSHRILGVHISKVRSLELDVKAWTDDMISVFHRIGNRRANEYFERTLDTAIRPKPDPESDMKVREAFIEDKYTKGTWSGVVKAAPEELDQQLMQVVQTSDLHRTLALLMSGANVKYIDPKLDSSRKTPYLMALASAQKAQAQLLLMNDADPVLPDECDDIPDQDTIDLEGILEKKGPNAMQSYKKRKCILSVPGKYLRYYDDHTFKSEINLRTMVDVQLADTENPDDKESKDGDGYTFLRLRTDTRTYLFRDRDKNYMNTWYTTIRSTQVFGLSIDSQPKTSNGIPTIIHKCVMFLDPRIDAEGIYRISGVKTRIEKLKLLFNQNVHDVVLSDESTVTHDVTSLLKQYFRELPVSLLGAWNQQLTAAVQIDDETERLYQIQDIVYELPGTEFHTLKFLAQHLYTVAQQQSVNKMGSENLGVIFGPTLMSTHEVGSEFNPYEYQLISTLIDYFPWIFQVDVEIEASKGKELKLAEAELRKIMNSIDAPQGSADNSWIVEVFHQNNSVNIKIDSGQTLRDVSAEILLRTKLVDGDYALHEFLCGGALQRPVHLSEYLLNTTVTLWEERVQRSWLAIDYNSMKEKLRNFETPQVDSTEQARVSGSLHLYEATRKKWREVHCKISSDNFSYTKLKVKTSLNLLNYTWYIGAEASLTSPPTRHCFTLRCLTPKDHHKDDIFKVFCAPDENELWRWLYRINYVKFKEADYRLVRSKRAVLQNPNNRNSFILLER